MPDGEQTEPPADADDPTAESSGDRIFSAYGIASAVLGALSVAAVALFTVIWSVHRGDIDERVYQSRVMQTAVDWTGVLINMNTDNIDASLQRLHDDLDSQLGARPPAPVQQVPLPAGTRTDTVMVVATSIAENVGGKPQTVHWNLRLDVSDVDGKLLMSRLESIR
jgi:hypothetical protein